MKVKFLERYTLTEPTQQEIDNMLNINYNETALQSEEVLYSLAFNYVKKQGMFLTLPKGTKQEVVVFK